MTKSSVHVSVEGCGIFISVCKQKRPWGYPLLVVNKILPFMPVNNAPVKQSAYSIIPRKATQSNVLVLVIRAYPIKDKSYLMSSADKSCHNQ